jgi:hypothetical protein
VAKAAVLTVSLLALLGGFGTKATVAHASQLLPKHHRIKDLPLKNQANWYRKNVSHAKNTLYWWAHQRKAVFAHSSPKYRLYQSRSIRFHQRLLRNATRNYKQIEAKINRQQEKFRKYRARVRLALPAHLNEWLCIHRYEGAWNDGGAPYYGGLQMDWGFMRTYGPEFLAKYGTADRWPPLIQMIVAERAYEGYAGYGPRYFGPWPNTSRMCGL